MHDDYLNAVLRRMCPQGFALLALEHGAPMLRLGARELVTNPRLAVEAIGPRGAKALGRALLAVGQRHVAVAERMLELAEEKAGREHLLRIVPAHSAWRSRDAR
jgi:hypothetical protein